MHGDINNSLHERSVAFSPRLDQQKEENLDEDELQEYNPQIIEKLRQ